MTGIFGKSRDQFVDIICHTHPFFKFVPFCYEMPNRQVFMTIIFKSYTAKSAGFTNIKTNNQEVSRFLKDKAEIV